MKDFYTKLTHLLFFVLICFSSEAQTPVSFYQDSFNGGVTCNGWSPGAGGGAGTGYFSINIYPGSTIHKAYLITGRIGEAADITVQLDTLNLTFNASTIVTPIFQISNYGGSSAVCAIDVTNLISDTVNNYSLTVPGQPGPSDCYIDFYLYVAYSNPLLPVVNTAIFLNQSNMADTMRFDSMALKYPFVNRSQFAVSMFTGYECTQITDGEYIYFNSDSLGLTGGSDTNEGSCGSTIGCFYYYSDSLHGLNGDSANLYMNGPSALSNVAPILPSGCKATTSSSMEFAHGGPHFTSNDNNIWGVVFAYGSPCEKMTVSDNASICPGSNVQLNITPNDSCYKYKWYPANGLNNDTITNPIAAPTATTTYTVIATSSYCSDTETTSVTIIPAPNVPTITVSVTGDSLISSANTDNQWYFNGSPIADSTRQVLVIKGHIKGWYSVTVTNEANGCSTSSDSTTSINRLSVNSYQLSIYPNPTNGEVTITSSKNIDEIKVTDVLGQLLLQSPPEYLGAKQIFELSKFADGMYFVTVTSGNDVVTKKVILSR